VIIYLITGLILNTPFCGDGERNGVSSHRIEESHAILVSQPELKCNSPKHIIGVNPSEWTMS